MNWNPSVVSIVTATGLEARAVRRALPNACVIDGGLALSRLSAREFDTVIVCGVGGGLRAGVPTGTVIVASEVVLEDGSRIATDPEMTAAMAAGAKELGFDVLVASLLTATKLVTGARRTYWADAGHAVVDMETGLIAARRLASVRVVLDTPERELSAEWLRPLQACLQPRLWEELVWLARTAPWCARRAAAIVRAGLLQLARGQQM